MNLLVTYIFALIIAQSLSVGVGLIVDRAHSSYGGLVVFIALYFTMFWAAWKFAVRITQPKANQETANPTG